MNSSHKAKIVFLAILCILSSQSFGLTMNQMAENLQTKNNEPQARAFSMKLPLLQPDYHWTFMSKEDFLSGKLVLNISRDEKNEEIVIFENGNLSEGWKEMSEQQVEGRGEIYFGFISTKKYLTAPGDKLELELTVTKDLPGIGAEKSGILPVGVYKSTGTYSGLLDEYDTSTFEELFAKSNVSEEQKQEVLDNLHSAYDDKAFLENWNEQWSLNITSQKGWLTDEQLLELDEARSRMIESSNRAAESRISGVVFDDKGEPLSNAAIYVNPPMNKEIKTDADGAFVLNVSMRHMPDEDIEPHLIIRHRERNLAAVVKLGEDNKNLEIKMLPGIIASGKVVDEKGKSLQNAKIELIIMLGEIGFGYREPVSIKENGDFQISAIPIGYNCSISARAEGYGSTLVSVNNEKSNINSKIIEPIVLKIANLSLTGIVLDRDDNPVEGANINSHGNGQEPRFTVSDYEGKFVLEGLCEGEILIYASKGDLMVEHGDTQAQAGAKDIKIRLLHSYTREINIETNSLVGKPLPDMKNIYNDFSFEKLKDKNVLVCLWDYEQRPSRNCILELAKQAEKLKENNVEIIAIQASKIESAPLDKWIQENNIPFSVRVISSDQEKLKADWSVKSLPWLILTDKSHKVTAEGFLINDLDEKLGNN